MAEEESTEGEFEYDFGEYVGERNDLGERHGFGKASFPNGDIYEGAYTKGARNGSGVYCFRFAKYTGEYKDGRRHGKGCMHYPDGSTYNGSWSSGSRNGPGLYTYVNGDTYEGEWKDDRKHGLGVYTYSATQAQYKGHWNEGRREGPAECQNEDHHFSGYFKENTPLGRGRFTFRSGCCQSGFYEMTNVVKQVDRVMELVGQEAKWRCTSLTAIKQKTNKV